MLNSPIKIEGTLNLQSRGCFHLDQAPTVSNLEGDKTIWFLIFPFHGQSSVPFTLEVLMATARNMIVKLGKNQFVHNLKNKLSIKIQK